MSNFREIVTKAIIGKHKKSTTDSFLVETEEQPNTVLGCWVINNTFKGINSQGNLLISGTYDVNVWYSYDNDSKTKVSTKKYTYNDTMNINNKVESNHEIIVECLKQPTVTDVKIENDVISLKVEKEMGIEIIGNTTVKIATEDDFDDYEEIVDDDKTKELNINVDELDDDYIDVN